MNSPEWLSIVEYARTYAVSDMTVRRRIKTGRLHAELREGKYYIPVRSEDSFLSSAVPQQSSGRPSHAPVTVMKSHPDPIKTHMQAPVINSLAIDLPTANPVTSREASQLSAPREVRDLERPTSHSAVLATDNQGPSVSQFADLLINRFNKVESHLEECYRTRMEKLTEELKNRDLVIHSLKQNVEDLQTLVKVLEGRR
jgi:hypothetical protein